MESTNDNSNRWKGAFRVPEVQVFRSLRGRDILLTCSAQDDVMIDIFFDNAKDSIRMSIESSILTEPQSERLVSEWSRTIMGILLRGREGEA